MDRHRLRAFQAVRNPTSGDLLLLADGPVLYKAVLSRAFPGLYFSRTFDDRHGRFPWGTYIKKAGDADEQELRSLCELLSETWLLEDDLTETMALSLHTATSPTGGFQRTLIGQLVYEAKSYDRINHPGDEVKASLLADRMAEAVGRHPTFRRAELIVSVPGSNRDKAYDLPAFLSGRLSHQLGVPSPAGVVSKSREPQPMKNCKTLQEKVNNVEGVYRADTQVVAGKTVLVVDDIYQTGFTINEVGRALRSAGASLVLGLVATKTMQDLGEDQPW